MRNKGLEEFGKTKSFRMVSFLSVLSILLPLLSKNGVGSWTVLAFTTVRRHNIIPTAPSLLRNARNPSSSSTTALFYMTDGSTDDESAASVPANPSKSLKKKLKKLKKKVTVSRRSHQLYKRGMQAASEEELASHVQADFHAGFGLDSLDFGSNIDDINDDEDEIDDDDECDEEEGF